MEDESVLVGELFDAAKRGNLDALAESLEAAGSSRGAALADELGNTPLHYAAGGGHADACAALLAAGADINAANAIGQTPLHRAAMRCRAQVVELLVARGANIEAVDKEGDAPRDVCNDATVRSMLAPDLDIGADDESSKGESGEDEEDEEEEDA
eukprot:m51a1_g8998 hypothetical protein (155) ;mRNA; f:102135-102705